MSILKESRDTLVIRGAIAPVFTAFTESGALDLDGQRRLLDFLVERGGIGRTPHFTPVRLRRPVAPGAILDLRMAGHDGTRLVAA